MSVSVTETKRPIPHNSRISLPARIIAAVFDAFLRLALVTWNRRSVGLEKIHQSLEHHDRLLVAFWHGKYLSLFPLLEGFDACILTSSSFRGEVIAALCRRYGFHCVFLAGRHGDNLLALLDRQLHIHHCLALAIDGPLGPYHHVKTGLVHLASQLRLLIVPVSVAAERKIVYARRWDRRELALPYSRVLLGVGDPFMIPPDLPKEAQPTWTHEVRRRMEATDQMVEELLARQAWSSGDRS